MQNRLHTEAHLAEKQFYFLQRYIAANLQQQLQFSPVQMQLRQLKAPPLEHKPQF